MTNLSDISGQAKQGETIYVAGQAGQRRWVAVTALFLAIGAVMRLVSPSVAGISPNWLIAMYCLAILLIRPGMLRAAGIGLVAGAVSVLTSKSIFPYGNLVSETVGAVVCAGLAGLPLAFKLGAVSFRPAVLGLLSTLASGFTFVTIAKLMLNLPLAVYLYGMLPVVLTVAAVNSIICQALYYPARRLLSRPGEVEANNAKKQEATDNDLEPRC